MRICVHCGRGEVEDEMHVFSCSKYTTLRQRYGITSTTVQAVEADLTEAKPNVLWYLYHVLHAVDTHCTSTVAETQ